MLVPKLTMCSFIFATAAGSGPAIAVFTRATISASRVGDANACHSKLEFHYSVTEFWHGR